MKTLENFYYSNVEPFIIPAPNVLVELIAPLGGKSASTSSDAEILYTEIPESFLRGLSDVEAGRVVDIDKAHNDAPRQC